LFLVRRCSPAATNVELDPGTRSIRCGLAQGTEEIRIKVGHGRELVIEDRHAVRDDTVSRPERTTAVAVQTVVRGVRERLSGDGRRRRRDRERLVTEEADQRRADDDNGNAGRRSGTAGCCAC
jgi:hypothetical protein